MPARPCSPRPSRPRSAASALALPRNQTLIPGVLWGKRAVSATRPLPASEHSAKEELTVPGTEQATRALGLPALFNKTQKWGPQTSMENCPHLWGAGPRGSADPCQRGAGQAEGLCATATGSPAPRQRRGHVSILVQSLPVSFPVKAFGLCVSVAPDSLGWALCTGRALARIPGEWPGTVLSGLCSLMKAGKIHQQECHTGGHAMKSVEGAVEFLSSASCYNNKLRLPDAHAVKMEAVCQADAGSGTGHLTISTAIPFACTSHTSRRRPLGLPKLLGYKKRGQAPVLSIIYIPTPSPFPHLCARCLGSEPRPHHYQSCD